MNLDKQKTGLHTGRKPLTLMNWLLPRVSYRVTPAALKEYTDWLLQRYAYAPKTCQILTMKFGLDGTEPKSCETVSELLGVKDSKCYQTLKKVKADLYKGGAYARLTRLIDRPV